MNLTAAVSALTVVLSVAAKGGALDQFRISTRTRTAGFSWRREAVNWGSYAAWVWHGLLAGQVVEVASQGLGVLMSGALLVQVVYYRRSPSPAEVTS